MNATLSANPTSENTERNAYIKHLWMHEFNALWVLLGVLMGLCAGFALGWAGAGWDNKS
jgi:hypothetical protein